MEHVYGNHGGRVCNLFKNKNLYLTHVNEQNQKMHLDYIAGVHIFLFPKPCSLPFYTTATFNSNIHQLSDSRMLFFIYITVYLLNRLANANYTG